MNGLIDVEAIAQKAADVAVAKAEEQWSAKLEALLQRRAEPLKPLHEILGCSPAAALKKLERDKKAGGNLHALGVRMPNGRLLFKSSVAEQYFGARK